MVRICTTLALAALLFGAAARAEEKEEFGRLTVDQVAEHVAKGDASIFDNNPKDMWQKGHVPTAAGIMGWEKAGKPVEKG